LIRFFKRESGRSADPHTRLRGPFRNEIAPLIGPLTQDPMFGAIAMRNIRRKKLQEPQAEALSHLIEDEQNSNGEMPPLRVPFSTYKTVLSGNKTVLFGKDTHHSLA
jgi:hypothetical protein